MPTVISVEEAKTQFSGLVEFVNLNKSPVTVLQSGRPVVRIMPIRARRNLEPDAFLSQVQVEGSLFDDDSADWEAMNG